MSDDTTEELQPTQELGAEEWRQRMLYIATELLKKPTDRAMEPAEIDLFVKGAMALAEMFLTMDERLVAGAVPPRSWLRDVPEPGKLPTSDLHRALQAEADAATQNLIEIMEKHVRNATTQQRLLQLLGKLLSTLALFTSESVRLACINNIPPEPAPGGTRLALVHNADKKDS